MPHASAVHYSLVETCKANGLSPDEYYREILPQLPYADTVEKLEALLPWNVKATLEKIGLRGGRGSTSRNGRLLSIRGVRGITLFKEYYKNPEATANSFDDDGWLGTGDIVGMDGKVTFFLRTVTKTC